MSLKQTPLYKAHRHLQAKLVEFGGWEMPIQYTSILEEHQTVRRSVGIFDVSHMGEIEISGPQALDLVQKLITNDASVLAEYQVLYSPMCYESGGTVDDVLVYRLPDRFWLIVNAANTEKDFAWVQQNAKAFPNVRVKDASAEYGQIAVQGPEAEWLLQPFTEYPLRELKYYWAVHTRVRDERVLLSRTGYTGEDGFEIYTQPELTVRLWNALLQAGAKPIGLGARDTLRFESGLPLYGHELDEKTTPVEANLSWTVKEKDSDYNGKGILLAQKRNGPQKRLIGLKLLEPGVPRQGYKILADGKAAGVITSGMFAPSVNAFLAMGYLPLVPFSERLAVEIRGQKKKAQIAKLPFYRGSVRRS
jgi:aminomethyltransferase